MVKIGQDGHKLSLSKWYAAIEILIFRPKPAARNLKNAKKRVFGHSRSESVLGNSPCQLVRSSVRSFVFSVTALTIFLNFCMKSGDHRC